MEWDLTLRELRAALVHLEVSVRYGGSCRFFGDARSRWKKAAHAADASSGTCTGQTHRVFELTAGSIDKLYKGACGEVRVAGEGADVDGAAGGLQV